MRCLLSSVLIFATCAGARADETILFNRDVRPILSDACFACHGPDGQHREAELRLDVESSAKEHVIVPGDRLASELFARITSSDVDLQMPPPDSGKKLTRAQIATLAAWIDQGAPYETHWAYIRPRPSPIPKTGSDWSVDPIDDFVIAKMRDQGLSPSDEADRRTLLRRLSFDLTGLPPTPAQVDSFVSDPSPTAYARVVDRLLASPAYGERMAIYWLDLVRFADTVGYHGDQEHNITPYRDYVIDALGDDMPLDQFTREQIAGDLIPEVSTQSLIASGYNRLLQTSHEGGVQPKEYLAIYAADRVRNLSAVWMGATVGCAQCHDHKFDPYTASDFYSLAAFFADIDEAQHFRVGTNSLPTKRPPEIGVLSRWQRKRLTEIEVRLAIGDVEDAQRDQLEAERAQLQSLQRLTMITESIDPREIRLFPRGDWLDESGPIVEPAVPGFLGDNLSNGGRLNRLDLANWLVDSEDGIGTLTARVFVNRFWYLLFGRGLSSSLDDFGGQGEPPTHPELLDQLAIDFVNDRWSIKRLIRRLVLTRTYRQSSDADSKRIERDPHNRWFARQSRYRLPAEMVRDNVLAISGLLVNEVGGASVKPHQPPGYYRHLNFPRRLYVPDRGQSLYRRGVYVHWQRQYLHPMLRATDAPTREECTAQRSRSNTPLEALVMLNDPSMIDAAIAFAARLMELPDVTDTGRISAGFALAVSRRPDELESSVLHQVLSEERRYYLEHPEAAASLVDSASSLVESKSLDVVQLAAWAGVARALLNTYETIARR